MPFGHFNKDVLMTRDLVTLKETQNLAVVDELPDHSAPGDGYDPGLVRTAVITRSAE